MEVRVTVFIMLAVVSICLILNGAYLLGKQAQMEKDLETMRDIQADLKLIHKLVDAKRGDK